MRRSRQNLRAAGGVSHTLQNDREEVGESVGRHRGTHKKEGTTVGKLVTYTFGGY
jgi:hypothetical protein